MEAYMSFSSLRDMLDQHQSHNSKTVESLSSQCPISENQVPHENLPSVTQMFGELYFNKSNSTSSSTQLFFFPPPSSSPSLETNSIEGKTNLQKNKVAENGCIYNKKSWGKKERLFPPPISSLKSAKSGEPFVYFRLDENSSTFVLEEIRIPKQKGLLHASRDSGGLKLNFGHEDEEPKEEEEEDDDEKKTGGEEWEVVDFCDFVIDDE